MLNKFNDLKSEISMSKEIRFCFEIEEGARLLYAELKSVVDESCTLTYQTKILSNLFQVSDATMRKWLNQLCMKGFIRLEKAIHDGKRLDVIRLVDLT